MSCTSISIYGLYPETDITEEDDPCFTYVRPSCIVVIPSEFTFITTVPYNVLDLDYLEAAAEGQAGELKQLGDTLEEGVTAGASIHSVLFKSFIHRYTDISEDGADVDAEVLSGIIRTPIHRYEDTSNDGTDLDADILAGVLDTVVIRTEIYDDGTLEDIDANASIVSGSLT